MRKDNSFQTRNFGVTFFRFSILISSLVLFFVLTKIFDAQAESVTTAVTVGNSAPTFTSGPAENPASTTASPTNVGSNVTFQATGTDANGENYYLVVCSTSSATARTGQSPTCAATTWCTSTSTASGSPTSCTHTAVIGDASSNNWYAFVCDSGSSPSCSSGNPGTGDSGSPFDVNHAPSFTAVSNDSPKDPGGTITWSTTASDSTDSDNIKLLVCKTTGISGDACDGGAGDTWCSSSSVASNPTCQYSIPSVAPDGANDAYVYIVDAHNFPATGAYQGTNVSFTINNVTPVVSAVTINGGAAINLTESTTKAVTVTATVSDNNSCYGSELATVYAYMYRTGVGFTGCDTAGEANSNYCYPEVSCTVVGGSCTDNTDASANYTCTVNLQYYADPTDDNTVYPTEFWKDTVEAWDDDGASATSEVSTGVKVNSLTAFDITGSINFGNLGIGQSNDPLDKTVTTTPTGNVGLDQEHSGAANMCTDYPTCSGGTPIGVTYQKYALASLTSYASGSALSTSPTEVELNVAKVINGTPVTKNTWWGILIPSGTTAGSYSGANTITAVKGETANW